MRRYEDCMRTDGMCGACSCMKDGKDCHGKRIIGIQYQRTAKKMHLRELAERSGVYMRLIQKYESGEYDVQRMTLKNAIAIARALQCNVEDLL